jgi:hypothetical protein
VSAVARLRDLDSHSWVIASWSAPFVAPLLVDMLMVTFWLLGKWSRYGFSEFPLFVSAVIVETAVLMAVATLMLMSRSSAVRGLSVCIAGTSTILLVGGLAFALLLLI